MTWVLITATLLQFSAHEWIYEFSRGNEGWELDEFFIGLALNLLIWTTVLLWVVYHRSQALTATVLSLESTRWDLLEANRKTKEASGAKSEFLANVSHELRTPLNAVIGFSESMRNETFGPLDNEKYREYAEHIHDSGTYLLDLINDILDISAVEAGESKLHEEETRLDDVIQSCCRLMEPRAEKSGVAMIVETNTCSPIIRADRRRLLQILFNLVSNAVKFTPDGGTVSIERRVETDGSLTIAVEDTGIGMDQLEVATAMRRFGRARDAHHSGPGGTGIGLPLANEMIRLHSGTLELVSEPDHGTVAIVRLPAEKVLGASGPSDPIAAGGAEDLQVANNP